jgi:glycosyltransferase involved in cell wall biosynthesis
VKIAIVSGDDVSVDDPRRLCAALVGQGHEVTAYPRQRAPRRPAETGTGACGTAPIPVGPRTATSTADMLPYVGQWAAALERAWSSSRPDVVHAYGWLGGLAAQLAARRQRVPTVQTFLGLATTSPATTHESERRRIEPLLGRNAAWVTGESSADVDALARLRRSRGRASALTSGVDVERFSPVGPAVARTAPHRILCLAPNPLWHNGFDIAIKALPRVAGAELVLAETDPTDPSNDLARARLASLAAELPMLMRSADVVACAPRQPPRATTVLQAMASGVVVVAAGVGVVKDVVVDGVTGLIVPPESPSDMAAAMKTLVAQRFQCESMGAAGRSHALSRFTWDRIALDAVNIYRRLESQGAVSPHSRPSVTP